MEGRTTLRSLPRSYVLIPCLVCVCIQHIQAWQLGYCLTASRTKIEEGVLFAIGLGGICWTVFASNVVRAPAALGSMGCMLATLLFSRNEPCWLDLARGSGRESSVTGSLVETCSANVGLWAWCILWSLGLVAVESLLRRMDRRPGADRVTSSTRVGDMSCSRYLAWVLVAFVLGVIAYGTAYRHVSDVRVDYLVGVPLWFGGFSLMFYCFGPRVRVVLLSLTAVALVRIVTGIVFR